MRELEIKLIGASLAMSFFLIYISLSVSFNLFLLHETLSTLWVWLFIFVYGIMSSLLIGWVVKKWKRAGVGTEFLLYIGFGYLIFIIMSPNEFGLIAGTVGAIFALIFLMGEKWAKRQRMARAAYILPVLALCLIPFEWTNKEGWTEVRQGEMVLIQYEAFNGEHLIPIEAKAGEQLFFKVDHHFRDGGERGVSLYDEEHHLHPMTEHPLEEEVLGVEPSEDSTYYIVIRGIAAKEGKVEVTWWQENKVVGTWDD